MAVKTLPPEEWHNAIKVGYINVIGERGKSTAKIQVMTKEGLREGVFDVAAVKGLGVDGLRALVVSEVREEEREKSEPRAGAKDRTEIEIDFAIGRDQLTVMRRTKTRQAYEEELEKFERTRKIRGNTK